MWLGINLKFYLLYVKLIFYDSATKSVSLYTRRISIKKWLRFVKGNIINNFYIVPINSKLNKKCLTQR